MKILILHNSYQQRGGEDTVVAAETKLLEDAGHSVRAEIVSNEQISGFADKLRTLRYLPFDPHRVAWMERLLDEFCPDVVHVHNFFPLLTSAVHSVAASRGLPIVQTLHNYRLACAGAQFLRDGQVCEKCLEGSNAWGVFHRCYRNSLPGSFALMRMQNHARREGGMLSQITRFIALTEFAKSKFVQAGIDANSIVVKPNFVADPGKDDSLRAGALFVGRLAEEKGVHTLLDAWRNLGDIPLTFVGDGPEMAALRAKAPANVRFAGSLGPEGVAREMRKAAALVVPSIWYEGFPMVVLEGMAHGLPIFASQIGSLTEIVEDGVFGGLAEPGSAASFAEKLREAFRDKNKLAAMGRSARQTYLDRYTPQANIVQLETIYRDAIGDVRRAG